MVVYSCGQRLAFERNWQVGALFCLTKPVKLSGVLGCLEVAG